MFFRLQKQPGTRPLLGAPQFSEEICEFQAGDTATFDCDCQGSLLMFIEHVCETSFLNMLEIT